MARCDETTSADDPPAVGRRPIGRFGITALVAVPVALGASLSFAYFDLTEVWNIVFTIGLVTVVSAVAAHDMMKEDDLA